MREKLSSGLNEISLNDMKNLHKKLLEIYQGCAQSSEFFPSSVSKAVKEMDEALKQDLNPNMPSSESQYATKLQKQSKKVDDKMEGKNDEKVPGRRSRKAMLLCGSVPDKEVPLNSNALGLSRVWPQIFLKHVCEMILKIPSSHRMANAFCCGRKSLEERQATASVRKDIHDALRDPQRYYESTSFSEPRNKVIGTVPLTEDTCTAYQLFDEDQSCTNLVEWFLAFECVKNAENDICQEIGDERDKGSRLQLMGRFSQSLQDLQFIGMIKSSRRRKGDHAQRNIFMPVDN